ncbi:MAG: aldo/keto reductase [Planctomycetota bacterium]
MQTRPLGANSGIDVTEIGLGLWAQGGGWGPTDDEGALDAIEEALDRGVTFFDTADVYGDGHSERLLAKAMKGRRDRFIVGSKIGWVGFDGENGRSQYDSVEKLIAGVEENLSRLGTDHLDLIQCHVFFEEPNTPVFIEGFRELKRQGKVRAWGLSTSNLSLVKTFNTQGDCDTLQIDYSILNRDAEREVFPYCQEHGVGVIVRGPIAMGLLAGKFDASTTFADGDFRQNWISDPAQHAQFKADLAIVDQLKPIAEQAGMSLVELALRFTISHPAVSTVIPGARNRHQAASNTEAGASGALSEEVLREVEIVVPSGGGRRIWPAEG